MTHRIPAAPHQISRLRSGERIVLVERVISQRPLSHCSEFMPLHGKTGAYLGHVYLDAVDDSRDVTIYQPYSPGDVLEFMRPCGNSRHGTDCEVVTATRTVSTITAKLGRDVTEEEAVAAGFSGYAPIRASRGGEGLTAKDELIGRWIVDHGEPFRDDQWYWMTEAT